MSSKCPFNLRSFNPLVPNNKCWVRGHWVQFSDAAYASANYGHSCAAALRICSFHLFCVGEGGKLRCLHENIKTCNLNPDLYCFGEKIEKNEIGGACSTHGGEAYTGFWWGNLRKRDHLGDPGIDGRIILRWIFRKWDVGVWTGSSWLSIETGDGYF